MCLFFFFKDPATTEIYTLSLHDALPICTKLVTSRRGTPVRASISTSRTLSSVAMTSGSFWKPSRGPTSRIATRSEEHTSELQSRQYLVCRLLLEKKKNKQ